MPVSSFDRIVDLLNEASLIDDVQQKVTKLLQVKELIIHHESSLLDNFFEEVAAFQHDPSFEVRKIVITFIQEACQVDPSLLKKAVGYLFYLFSSAVQQEPPAINLLRCLTMALISVYRISLTRAVKVGIVESGVTIVSSTGISADSAADIALETFRSVAGLKDEIVRLMMPQAVPGHSAFTFMRPIHLNDITRQAVINLVESVIILQSRRLPNSEIPPLHEGDISLDQIPDMTNAQLQAVLEASTAASSATLLPGVCLVRPRRLNEEAERLFAALLEWPIRSKSVASAGPISCSSLEAVMESLVSIAKQRPQFMDRVVQLFETVHVTFPPYFSDVQVSNVRKKLKTGLLQLLRHPAAISDYQGRITILLTDLGATQVEVMEALHKLTEFRRPQIPVNPSVISPPPDTNDHGDIDMRQLPILPDNIPNFKPAAVEPIIREFRTVPSPTGGSTPSEQGQHFESLMPNVQVTTTPTPTTSVSTSLNDPRLHTTAGFSLVNPEAALQFDDDDDDDDDDAVQIVRPLRVRSGRSTKRSTITTPTSSSATTILSGDLKAVCAGPKDLNVSKLDLPPVDFVTIRLVPKLTTANVADLVLLSMVTLPDQMPAAFQSTYTPIAAAGTSAQIRHLARMLAVQLVVWAGEGSHPDPTDNLAQLESLLRPSQDELEELGVPGIKRTSKSEASDSTGLKTVGKTKKRRMAAVGDKSDAGTEAEDEDAMIRANAARRMHGGQPMNISTLVTYNQQSVQQPSTEILPGTIIPPGLPSMFASVPPPSLPAPVVGAALPLPFNPSQPPPSLHVLPLSSASPALNTPIVSKGNTVAVPVQLPVQDVVSIPLPGRPFSLDAVTVPLGRNTQRQLARDAFIRILEELDDTSNRRSMLTTSGAEGHMLLVDSGVNAQHLSRMKLLTRLTTRRFGGNEFYNVLIDYAIKNLRNGFELLSKLLMQEYCRFRGFQLLGFDQFLQSRRHQLKQLRARQLGTELPPSISVTSSPKQEPDNSKTDSLSENQWEDQEMKNHSAGSARDDMDRSQQRDETFESSQTSAPLDEEEEPDENEEERIELLEYEDEKHSKRPPASSARKKPDHKPSSIQTATTCKEVKTRVVSSPDDLGCLSFYDCLLIEILQRLAHPDIRQSYFGRFLLEAPLLTPGALSVLKRYCCTPSQTRHGFEVLRTLIELRPVGQREDLLNMLLNFCAVDNTEVRQSALTAARELASLDTEWQEHIESFAINVLKKLLQPRPTADIFPFNPQPIVPGAWNDEACQACAHLFLGLMPQSPALMHELAKVYVDASPDVKRCILRMIDVPIREIGLYSAAIHDLVDKCPVGAETLVTRMIHLLTDSPSALAAAAANSSKIPLAPSIVPPVIVPPHSLVDRVYRLYRERVHDIRCLIPVLVGLPKHEVISVLPRLVQLSDKVVKEVLTRLLHASVSTQYAPMVENVKNFEGSLPNPNEDEPPLGPLKPEELLVAVHLLEFAKDPATQPAETDQPNKPYVSLQAILHACRVCFAERRLFTQERLSVAIGQLLDQPVLPTLFMRTVMQALALHPRLAGYVINVLVNLIPKQIWKSEKLWDGFIRCCVKTRPQSYQVLLQLPPERLEDVFKREPGMRMQVRRYVENFSSAQRVHISKSIIEVLERVPTPKKPSSKSTDSVDETALRSRKQDERPASRSPSPASSGPGTPTRDEMPLHEVPTSLVVAATVLNSGHDSHSKVPISSGFMALPVVVGGRTSDELIPSSDSMTRNLLNRFQPIRHFTKEQKSDSKSYSRTAGSGRNKGRELSPFSHELRSSTEMPTPTCNKAPVELGFNNNRSVKQSVVDESLKAPRFGENYDDDLEPPTLPPTKIHSAPSKGWRAHVGSDEAAQLMEPFDQSPLDWSTEDPDEVNSSALSERTEDSRRPRRAVDLEKLEADRKRLEEEASKYKKLRAERKKGMDTQTLVPEANMSVDQRPSDGL